MDSKYNNITYNESILLLILVSQPCQVRQSTCLTCISMPGGIQGGNEAGLLIRSNSAANKVDSHLGDLYVLTSRLLISRNGFLGVEDNVI